MLDVLVKVLGEVGGGVNGRQVGMNAVLIHEKRTYS